MEIIKLELNGWTEIVFTLNWIAVLLLAVLAVVVGIVIKHIAKHKILKSVQISEAKIGIGSSSVVVKYDKRVQEIAYKLWVELQTRKIGIMFDEQHDVITEVYNSWYEAFGVIRKLLEEIPAERINSASGLIEITTKVLNEGLRPHLTKWQAKYRCWYDQEKQNNYSLPPQEVQQKYPEYQDLITEIKATNAIMIGFADELKQIVYDKKEAEGRS